MYLGSPLPLSSRGRLENTLPIDLALDSYNLTDLHKIAMGITGLDLRRYLFSHLSSRDMINKGDSDNRTPLLFASARGDAIAVQALLDAGALPNITATVVGQPLHVACLNTHPEIVKKLIIAGANVHCRIPVSFRTPLHTVCSGLYWNPGIQREARDSVAIVSILLQYGVDMEAVDRQHATPLIYASSNNHDSIVKFLIASGADPSHRDWEGSNALANAIFHNTCNSASVLLRYNEAIGSIDNDGWTILHYVAMMARLEMMELFLANTQRVCGLNATRRDNHGRTPLQLFNSREIVTDQLRETFLRLLEAIAVAKAIDGMEMDSDDDSEAEEFHDALEN